MFAISLLQDFSITTIDSLCSIYSILPECLVQLCSTEIIFLFLSERNNDRDDRSGGESNTKNWSQEMGFFSVSSKQSNLKLCLRICWNPITFYFKVRGFEKYKFPEDTNSQVSISLSREHSPDL